MDRKEEILEAASRVFEKYGLAKSTLEDIALECGIKKTALYYYFKNKEELFKTMFMKDIESIKKHIDKEVLMQETTIGKFRVYMIQRVKSMDKMRKYFDIFQGDNASASYRDFAFQEKEKVLRYEMDKLTQVASEGVKNGELEIENIRSFVLMIRGVALGLTHEFLIMETASNAEEEVNNILQIILKGIQKKQENK
jgi:AcrR family transcriptional regulator